MLIIFEYNFKTKTMKAILLNYFDLTKAIKQFNNGTTDTVRFIQHGDDIKVYDIFGELSKERQESLLRWFLEGHKFDLVQNAEANYEIISPSESDAYSDLAAYNERFNY